MIIKKIRVFISGIVILSFFAFIVISNHGQIFAAATLQKTDAGGDNLSVAAGSFYDDRYTISYNINKSQDYPAYDYIYSTSRSPEKAFKYQTDGTLILSEEGGPYGGNGITTNGKYVYIYDAVGHDGDPRGIAQYDANLQNGRFTPYARDNVGFGDIVSDGQSVYTTNSDVDGRYGETCKWGINQTTGELTAPFCVGLSGFGLAFDGTSLYLTFVSLVDTIPSYYVGGIAKLDTQTLTIKPGDSIDGQALLDGGFLDPGEHIMKLTANEQYIFGYTSLAKICKWSVGSLTPSSCQHRDPIYLDQPPVSFGLTIVHFDNNTDYLYVYGFNGSYGDKMVGMFDLDTLTFQNRWFNPSQPFIGSSGMGSFRVVDPLDNLPSGVTLQGVEDGGVQTANPNRITWKGLNADGNSHDLHFTLRFNNPSGACNQLFTNNAFLRMGNIEIARADDTTFINCAATFSGVTVLVTWPEGPNIGKVELKTKLSN